MRFININGKITTIADAAMPPDNGSFRYGYGLFETMLLQDGAISLAHYHWERLFAGLAQLHLEPSKLMTAQWLENEVLRTAARNKLTNLCRVRLQLFAAGGGMYGLESAQPGMLIECFVLEPDALVLNENGLATGIATGLAKSNDSLSNMKSANALIYAMAARQAKTNKWNDALLVNTAANIIESTIANIFWVKDGSIFTPPLADGCVAGVMRRHILDKVPDIVQKSLTAAGLQNADEVFLTNAIKKVRWISTAGNALYTCHTAREIHSLLR